MGYYKKLVLPDSERSNVVLKSGKTNKKILAFIFCLVISIILWTIVSLNKSYSSSITFLVKIEGIQNKKIVANIYGSGFDIIKEKLFNKQIILKNMKMQSMKSEDLIREQIELDEHLKYSDFEPASIVIK